jgi:hypothetical protein
LDRVIDEAAARRGARRTGERRRSCPGRSVNKLERGLARDVVNELEGIAVPFCGQRRQHTGSDVSEGRPVSRIDRLLDNIEISQLGQQRQRLRRADAGRPAEACGVGQTATVEHPARVGAKRNAGAAAYDDPSNYLG